MRFIVPFIIAFSLLISCNPETSQPPIAKSEAVGPDPASAGITTENEYDDFGFRVDAAEVQDYKVKKNESLYLILDKFDFSEQEIYNIIQQAKDFIDVRSFKPGQRYRIYASLNDEQSLSRLVWQPNPVDYVVFDWQDSLKIYKSSKIIKTEIETAAAEVKGSLYETIAKEGLSPLLAYKLSEIYAWEIDFFSLRRGDSFKIVYEKKFVDDKFYDIGDIKAVEFTHRGKSYSALKFEDEHVSGYFDAEGNSVQKALLKAPFKYSQRISSGFSHNRFHPVLKRRIPHYGVDYAAPHGTPILSVGDGTITEARYRGANGNIIKIRHNSIYETAYLHLSGFARGIERGSRVSQGQVIGYVGNTGRVTGTHLDYRIYKNGRPVNPLTVDLPPSEGIPSSSLEAFKERKNRYQKMIMNMTDPQPMLTGYSKKTE